MPRPQRSDHELHDAAKPGSYRSWHVWVWGVLILVGMIALVAAIQFL